MLTRERLKTLLESLEDDAPQVEILDNSGVKFLAQVVSPSFETMDEGDRQALAWGKLLDELPDHESRRVEFVYTDSPSEVEQYEAEAREAEAAHAPSPDAQP